MRRFALIVLLLVVCWLCIGILSAKAKEVSMDEIGAWWVSLICDTTVETYEITFVGEHEGKYYFFTPLNEKCEYTGASVWSLPEETRYIN